MGLQIILNGQTCSPRYLPHFPFRTLQRKSLRNLVILVLVKHLCSSFRCQILKERYIFGVVAVYVVSVWSVFKQVSYIYGLDLSVSNVSSKES